MPVPSERRSRHVRAARPGPLLDRIEQLDIPEVSTERMLALPNARVAFADYELLQQDFPQLRDDWIIRGHPDIARRGRARREAIRRVIDHWILRNAALVSVSQAEPNDVNTPIATGPASVLGYRPPRYGRAIVSAVRNNHRLMSPAAAKPWRDEPSGLLDLKGVGLAPGERPRLLAHRSGLLHLGSALADIAMEWMISEVFRHAGVPFGIVPTYAAIDAGFDYLMTNGKQSPAGIQVRRAHRRRRQAHGWNLPEIGTTEHSATKEIEMLLRRYGISSCGGPPCSFLLDNTGESLQVAYESRTVARTHNDRQLNAWTEKQRAEILRLSGIGKEKLTFDGINVQVARVVDGASSSVRLVDFSQYTRQRNFATIVLSRARDQVMLWGGVIRPTDPAFAQPDPALALPWRSWGSDPQCVLKAESLDRPHRRLSYLETLTFELASRFREGQLSPGELRRKLWSRVEEARARWSTPAADETDL